VQSVNVIGGEPKPSDQPRGFTTRHPHTIGEWNQNNTIYVGRARLAATAPSILRLSIPGEQVSRWRVPPWLRAAGLTYHRRPERWEGNAILTAASRGQEFVADISNVVDAATWLDGVKAAIARGPHDHS
jgi:hypothetical protein